MKYSISVLAVVFTFACYSSEPTFTAETHLENDAVQTSTAEVLSGESVPRPSEEPLKQLQNKYPGFAGFYCENEQFVIAMTNPEELSDIASEIGEETASECNSSENGDVVTEVRMTSARYDFASLRYWRDKTFSLLHEEHAVSLYIDFKLNRVVLGVEPGYADATTVAVSALDIPADAFLIVEETRQEPMAACPNPTTGTVDLDGGCFRPQVPGGAQLLTCPNGGCPGAGGFCTITAPAIRGGVLGYVTAGHCVPRFGFMESDYIYQPLKDGLSTVNMVGFEFVDPPTSMCNFAGVPLRCRLSDAAWLFPFTAPSGAGAPERGKIARPQAVHPAVNKRLVSLGARFTISSANPSIQGQTVHKVGRSTGWSSATVAAVCIDNVVTFPEPVPTTILFLCQDRAPLFLAEGDSGSPVFSSGLPGNSVRLKGVISTSGAVYSPWANVQSDLGALTVTP